MSLPSLRAALLQGGVAIQSFRFDKLGFDDGVYPQSRRLSDERTGLPRLLCVKAQRGAFTQSRLAMTGFLGLGLA